MKRDAAFHERHFWKIETDARPLDPPSPAGADADDRGHRRAGRRRRAGGAVFLETVCVISLKLRSAFCGP